MVGSSSRGELVTRQPHELRELARTRVAYEHGRFLTEAVLRLDGGARDRIVAWAVETNQPDIMRPQTTVQLIESLAHAEYGRQCDAVMVCPPLPASRR